MARYLADTNLLLRLMDTHSPQNPIAAHALATLFRANHEVFITAQNLVEFWAVATRPVGANGLGWDLECTRREIKVLRDKFPVVEESPQILIEWLRLVENIPVVGKRVHDARLVAVMKANAIDCLLTFNPTDFAGFHSITVVEPASLANSAG